MMLCWDWTHETLCGIDVINSNHIVIRANCHVITSRMKCETTNRLTILNFHKKVVNNYLYLAGDDLLSSIVTVNTLCAFFTDAFEISNNLTVQSLDPDAKIGSFGWNSRNDTSSVWSYSVRITGCPCCSPRPVSVSSGADFASIRSTSKILILASTLPVATCKWKWKRNHNHMIAWNSFA